MATGDYVFGGSTLPEVSRMRGKTDQKAGQEGSMLRHPDGTRPRVETVIGSALNPAALQTETRTELPRVSADGGPPSRGSS